MDYNCMNKNRMAESVDTVTHTHTHGYFYKTGEIRVLPLFAMEMLDIKAYH